MIIELLDELLVAELGKGLAGDHGVVLGEEVAPFAVVMLASDHLLSREDRGKLTLRTGRSSCTFDDRPRPQPASCPCHHRYR